MTTVLWLFLIKNTVAVLAHTGEPGVDSRRGCFQAWPWAVYPGSLLRLDPSGLYDYY